MNSHTTQIKRPASALPSAAGPRSDEELLLAYRRHGDRQAFAELVHRYERQLYSYLRRFLGNPVMAEDVFQATFLQVHLNCNQFEEGRSFRPWLFTIATNQAIDSQRRNRRHRLMSLDRRHQSGGEDDLGALLDLLQSREAAPTARMEQSERRQWVRKAVNELPDIFGRPLNLIYFQGLKYREAADVLGIPVGTVKSRVHTAVFKLNEAWNAANLSGDK